MLWFGIFFMCIDTALEASNVQQTHSMQSDQGRHNDAHNIYIHKCKWTIIGLYTPIDTESVVTESLSVKKAPSIIEKQVSISSKV